MEQVEDHAIEVGTVQDLDGYQGALGGLTRREFLSYCTGVAATLGLSSMMGLRIAAAATAPARPPVIWLSAQECTGCTESLLRAYHPTLETLILDMISLDYHEALCAGAGHQAEAYRAQSMKANWGKYILVVDGSIPTKDGGIYCMVAGRPILETVREAAEGAAVIIGIGSCASWGGIPSSDPNPTGAQSVHAVLPGKTVVNIPGCPPNPYNFLSTVLYLLTFGKPPELDSKNRPRFAYGRLIHENCERRPHFDAGRFALEFGDFGHRQGFCLYKIGCKGPETYANCPAIGFGDVGEGNWPVGIGHPCFGCTEEGVGFTKPLHALSRVKTYAPPTAFPAVDATKGEGVTPAAVAIIAGAAGLAVGAGAMALRGMDGKDESAAGSSHDSER
ncbi:MAG: hydrogenase small subunit [Candidatus Competibacteraceae bacterium]|uniref:hydrogenase (acceptor) n=1 Tax=Candidatus Contendobacter odensis Run_B_J11 TaxID=1400861 RepID=A0A7U7G8Q9_9GAMM|nr:hydrogenase small subunit [Candidatus Contendobacter odensis]MBK8535581.1 hydrogenase small subunit [Candidatus Competibacteraceae bacterium]CDH43980.1 hydrogenase 2, small subunit [Candidatus Contendobacter odensis Run_B_J11]